tara:strand:- start:4784 stop:16507 length:11724 start_codon:yes stop_codon:yes gene_type:complete
MNEEAIQYAYDLFTKDGYSDSLDEFKVLMSENPKALSHSYGLFKQDGYGDSLEDFTNLMGVEQKPQEEQPKQDISQEDVKKKDSSDAELTPLQEPELITSQSEDSDYLLESAENRFKQKEVKLEQQEQSKVPTTEEYKAQWYENYGVDYRYYQELLKQQRELQMKLEKDPYGSDARINDNNLTTLSSRIDLFKDEFKEADIAYNTQNFNDAVMNYAPSEIEDVLKERGVDETFVQMEHFKINGENVSPVEMKESLLDQDFVDDLQEGKNDVYISPIMVENSEMGAYLNNLYQRQLESGDQWGDLADSFASGSLGLLAGIMEPLEGVLAYGSMNNYNITAYNRYGGEIARSLKESSEAWMKKTRAYEFDGITESLTEGNIGNAIAQFGNGLAQTAPQILSMYAGGGFIRAAGLGSGLTAKAAEGVAKKITLGAMGTSAYGQKSLDLKDMRERGEVDMSTLMIAINSMVSGGAEMVFEIPTYQYINTMRKMRKMKLVDIPKEMSENFVQNYFKGMGMEAASEMGTEVTNVLNDAITGAGTPESFVDAVMKVTDAGILGAGMGGVIGSRQLRYSFMKDISGDLENLASITITDNKTGSERVLTRRDALLFLQNEENKTALSNGDISIDTSIDSKVEAKIKAKLEGYTSQDAMEARDSMLELVKELDGSLKTIESVDKNNIKNGGAADSINGIQETLAKMDALIADKGTVVTSKVYESTISRLNSFLKSKGISIGNLANFQAGAFSVSKEGEDEFQAVKKALTRKFQKEAEEKFQYKDGEYTKKEINENRIEYVDNKLAESGFYKPVRVNVNQLGKILTESQIAKLEEYIEQTDKEVKATEGAREFEALQDRTFEFVIKHDGTAVLVDSGRQGKGLGADVGTIEFANINYESAHQLLEAHRQAEMKRIEMAKENAKAELVKKNNLEFRKADAKNIDSISQDDLQKDYHIVSSQKNGYTAEQNKNRSTNLKARLDALGVKYKTVRTVENGVSKESFMVEGLTDAQALNLGRGFSQTSVFSSKTGVLNSNGSVQSVNGIVDKTPDARNGASFFIMKDANGRKFSIRFGTNQAVHGKDINADNMDQLDSTSENYDATFFEGYPKNRQKILGFVIKMLSSIGNLNFSIARNSDSMAQMLAQKGVNDPVGHSRQSAFYLGNTIYLNMEYIQGNTLFHEIIHPLVNKLKTTKEGRKIYKQIEKLVRKADGVSDSKLIVLEDGRRVRLSYYEWAKQLYGNNEMVASYLKDKSAAEKRAYFTEEAFAEMMGDAAVNQFIKSESTLNRIKQAVKNIIQHYFGVDFDGEIFDLTLDTVQSLGDLKKGLAKSFVAGKKINIAGNEFEVGEPTEVAVFQAKYNSMMKNSLEAGEDMLTDFVEVSEDLLSDRGPAKFQLRERFDFSETDIPVGSIIDLNGERVYVAPIDRSSVGNLTSDSGVQHKMMGGLLYPMMKDTGGWAWTTKDKADSLLKKLKKQGVTKVAFMAMSDSSILGNINFIEYVEKEVELSLSKGNKKFKNQIIAQINNNFNKAAVVNHFWETDKVTGKRKKLKRDTNLPKKKFKNFDEFKAYMRTIGTGDRNVVMRELYKIEFNKKLGLPRPEDLLKFVNEPLIEKARMGDLIGVIDLDINATIKETKEGEPGHHPGYPFVLPGGNFKIFNKFINIKEAFPNYMSESEKKKDKPIPFKHRTERSAYNVAMYGGVVTNVDAVNDFTGGDAAFGRFQISNLYHGGPNNIDKFNPNYIKSHLQYGHGFYFSSEQEVASKYRDESVTSADDKIGGVPVHEYHTILTNQASAVRSQEAYRELEMKSIFLELLEGTSDFDSAVNQFRFEYEASQDLLDWANNDIRPNYKRAGTLVKVSLHDGKQHHEYDYLDWDSNVPVEKVEKIVDEMIGDDKVSKADRAYMIEEKSNISTAQLYGQLESQLGSQKEASMLMLSAGIDGMTYKEGDARNYVVFDPDAITIEETKFQLSARNSLNFDSNIITTLNTIKKGRKFRKPVKQWIKLMQDTGVKGVGDEIKGTGLEEALNAVVKTTGKNPTYEDVKVLVNNLTPDIEVTLLGENFVIQEEDFGDVVVRDVSPINPEPNIKSETITYDMTFDIKMPNGDIESHTMNVDPDDDTNSFRLGNIAQYFLDTKDPLNLISERTSQVTIRNSGVNEPNDVRYIVLSNFVAESSLFPGINSLAELRDKYNSKYSTVSWGRNRNRKDRNNPQNILINLNPKGETIHTSGHFGGFNNNLVGFVRTEDRIVGGKKVLVILEVQSDWEAEGRKKGFADPKDIAEAKVKGSELSAKIQELQAEERKLYDKLGDVKLTRGQILDGLQEQHERESNDFKDQIGDLDIELDDYDARLDELGTKLKGYIGHLLESTEELSFQESQMDFKANGLTREIVRMKENYNSTTRALEKKIQDLNIEEVRKEFSNNTKVLNRVPNFPWSDITKNTGLAVRAAMKVAIQNGYDSVALINGEESVVIEGVPREGKQAKGLKNFYDNTLPNIVRGQFEREGKSPLDYLDIQVEEDGTMSNQLYDLVTQTYLQDTVEAVFLEELADPNDNLRKDLIKEIKVETDVEVRTAVDKVDKLLGNATGLRKVDLTTVTVYGKVLTLYTKGKKLVNRSTTPGGTTVSEGITQTVEVESVPIYKSKEAFLADLEKNGTSNVLSKIERFAKSKINEDTASMSELKDNVRNERSINEVRAAIDGALFVDRKSLHKKLFTSYKVVKYLENGGVIEKQPMRARNFPITQDMVESHKNKGIAKFQLNQNGTSNLNPRQFAKLTNSYEELKNEYPDMEIIDNMVSLSHYTPENTEMVDPSNVKMTPFSNEQYNKWSRSRAFFDTNLDIKENSRIGDVQVKSMFPMDRLYPLDKDPLNLRDVANYNIDRFKDSENRMESTLNFETKDMDAMNLSLFLVRHALEDTDKFGHINTSEVIPTETGLSIKINYPEHISEEVIESLNDCCDNIDTKEVKSKDASYNQMEEIAKLASGLGFQGFLFDDSGKQMATTWEPVRSNTKTRFQLANQQGRTVYRRGGFAVLWDIGRTMIERDYDLGRWATSFKAISDKQYDVRLSRLFAKPFGTHSSKEVKDLMTVAQGALNKELFEASENVKEVKAAIIEYNNSVSDKRKIDGQKATELLADRSKILRLRNPRLKEAFINMRDHIDQLSKTLIREEIVDGPTTLKVDANLGVYLTRRYRQYEKKGWKQEDQKIINRALNFMTNSHMEKNAELSEQEAYDLAKQDLDIIQNGDETSRAERIQTYSQGFGNALTRVGSIFMARNEDLPVEIRDLLGEIHDPFYNYTNTISKIARTVTSDKMYRELIDIGEGLFLSPPDESGTRPAILNQGFNNQVKDPRFGSLNGYFLDDEMYSVLSEIDRKMNMFDNYFYQQYMKVVMFGKKMKTIWSVGTHTRNIIGNSSFMLMNGHLDGKKLFTSARVAIQAVSTFKDSEMKELYGKLVKLGVVSSSASLEEIRGISKDLSDADFDVDTFFADKSDGDIAKLLKTLDQKLTAAYQAEDDVFKIFGFLSEKEKYMKAGLSENEADLVAAENVRNTYPNYNEIPRIIRFIGRSPFVGTFVAFQAESIRCAKNSVMLAFNEMSSGNPELKSMGVSRLASSIATITLVESLQLMMAQMLLGAGDDEEVEKRYLRALQPDWDQTGFVVPKGSGVDEKGRPYVDYVNMSKMSGIGYIRDMIRIAVKGVDSKDGKDALVRILETIYKPFLSEEMTLNAIQEARDNEFERIYNNEAPWYDIIPAVVTYVGGKLAPSTAMQGFKLYDAFDPDKRRVVSYEISALLGFRVSRIYTDKSVQFKLSDQFNKIKSRAKGNKIFYEEGINLPLLNKEKFNLYDQDELNDRLNRLNPLYDPHLDGFVDQMAVLVAAGRAHHYTLNQSKELMINKLKVPNHLADHIINRVWRDHGKLLRLPIGDTYK